MAERYKPLHPLKEETELKEGQLKESLRKFSIGEYGGIDFEEQSDGSWKITSEIEDGEDLGFYHEDAVDEEQLVETFLQNGILVTRIESIKSEYEFGGKKTSDSTKAADALDAGERVTAILTVKIDSDSEWSEAIQAMDERDLSEVISRIEVNKLKDPEKKKLVQAAQKLIKMMDADFDKWTTIEDIDVKTQRVHSGRHDL